MTRIVSLAAMVILVLTIVSAVAVAGLQDTEIWVVGTTGQIAIIDTKLRQVDWTIPVNDPDNDGNPDPPTSITFSATPTHPGTYAFLSQGRLLTVLESLGNYKGAGTLEAWAGKIAFHVAVRHKERRKMIETVMIPQRGEPGVAVSNPEQETSDRRVRVKVNAALSRLPVERRYTLVLRLIFGHSIAEIARLTGVPVNTVRGRLRTGLKELRQSMAAERDHIMAQ